MIRIRAFPILLTAIQVSIPFFFNKKTIPTHWIINTSYSVCLFSLPFKLEK